MTEEEKEWSFPCSSQRFDDKITISKISSSFRIRVKENDRVCDFEFDISGAEKIAEQLSYIAEHGELKEDSEKIRMLKEISDMKKAICNMEKQINNFKTPAASG